MATFGTKNVHSGALIDMVLLLRQTIQKRNSLLWQSTLFSFGIKKGKDVFSLCSVDSTPI